MSGNPGDPDVVRRTDSFMYRWLPTLITLGSFVFGFGLLAAQVDQNSQRDAQFATTLEKVSDSLAVMNRELLAERFERTRLADKIDDQRLSLKVVSDMATDLGDAQGQMRIIREDIIRLWGIARANQANTNTIANTMRDDGKRIELQIPDVLGRE